MSLIRLVAAHNHRKHELEQEQATTVISTNGHIEFLLLKCDVLRPNRTSGGLSAAHSASGTNHGIWPNLTANLIFLAVAMAVFILLKKKIYNQTTSRGKNYDSITAQSPWSRMIYGNKQDEMGDMETDPQRFRWYSWLTNTLSESEFQILSNGGLGALEYVRFQRCVLWYTVVACIIALLFILPVNLAGNQFTDAVGRSSIANLNPSSRNLWIHALFSMILLPMGVIAMSGYGMGAPRNPRSRNRSVNTVMFSGLPSKRANTEMLHHHFDLLDYSYQRSGVALSLSVRVLSVVTSLYFSKLFLNQREAYPGFEIMDIALTYDIAHLAALEEELRSVEAALAYCESHPLQSQQMQIRLGNGCCGCCQHEMNAEKYYALRKSELMQQLQQEIGRWKRVNPVFFVTFGSETQARRVFRDHQPCTCCREKPQSYHSRELNANGWTAYHAPHPANVNWNNLGSSGCSWYFRAILLNLFVVGIVGAVAFLIILLNVASLPALGKLHDYPGVSQILPAMVMFVAQKLVAEVILFGLKCMKYWSKVKELQAQMKLLFVYLLFTVLILPSLGLIASTASYFLHPKTSVIPRPDCISLPDNGSLYIHYLIFVAFVGTALALFRLDLIFEYLCRACSARSNAEKALAGQVNRPFPFGEEYPKFLTAFAVTIVYSFINPLISVFGVIALMLKYLLDQYMLCNVYKRSNVADSVHGIAISQFFSAIFLQLLFLLFVIILRNGFDACAIVLALTILVYGAVSASMAASGSCDKIPFYEMHRGDGEAPESVLEINPTAPYRQPILLRLRDENPPAYPGHREQP